MKKSFTAGRNLLPVVKLFCKYFAPDFRMAKGFFGCCGENNGCDR